jgi:flagellar biosynthesis/type III secretory pathway M-ring protein FliF/YscJ
VSVLVLTSAPTLAGQFLTAGQSTPTPPPAPASGQEFGSASTLGFVVLVLFFIAVAFLARSMAKHLKRVQKPFEEEAERAAAEAEAAEEQTPDSDSDSPSDPESHKADA